MQHARFVFQTLSLKGPSNNPAATGLLRWSLISANNRRIGNCPDAFGTYAECRSAVLDLRRESGRLSASQLVDDRTGRVSWILELDSILVAVSSRSYLRARECAYNLERFLESLPVAQISEGVHLVRHNGHTSREESPRRKENR